MCQARMSQLLAVLTTLCVGTKNIYSQPFHELVINLVHSGNVGRAFWAIFGP